MARAITMRHTIVPSAERDDFRTRAERSLAHYSRAGCHYWLFEETALPGAYVEFVERELFTLGCERGLVAREAVCLGPQEHEGRSHEQRDSENEAEGLEMDQRAHSCFFHTPFAAVSCAQGREPSNVWRHHLARSCLGFRKKLCLQGWPLGRYRSSYVVLRL